MLLSCLIFCCLFLLTSPLFAQIEPLNSPYAQNGSYTVVNEIDNTNNPDIYAFRPTSLQERYPVLLFQLGANPLIGTSYIDRSSYDIYLQHLATYGYIVIVVDDAGAGFPNGSSFESVYDWYLQKKTDPNHWVAQSADTNNVIVAGHSLGGVNATAFLENNKNDIAGIVYFASFPSQGVIGIGANDIDDYTGKLLTIAGTEDVQSTPTECYEGYESYEQASCRYWVLLDSIGHGGFGDYNNPDQPVGSMGRQKVTASIRHYLVSFMNYSFKEDSLAGVYLNVFGQQPLNTTEFETNCLYINGEKSICETDTTSYNIGYNTGNSYCWQVSGGNIINNSNETIEVVWNGSGLGEINISECNRPNYSGNAIIDVGELPDTLFSYSSNNGLFDFQSAGNPNYTYTWLFGDGQTDGGPSPSVQYADTGTYIVQLEVNTGVCMATNSDTVVSDLCPVANFVYTPIGGGVQLENNSQFYNTASWDFGNGDTSMLINPVPNLEKDSSYLVQLIVSNDFCSDTISKTVTTGTCSQADFDFTVEGLEANFTNQSTDNQLNVWSIDGNTVSFNENFNYVFPDSGTYIVSLTVYDQNNCKDSTSVTLDIILNDEDENPILDDTTSVIETNKRKLKVYPNPASDRIFLSVSDFSKSDLLMLIYDLSGKTRYSGDLIQNIDIRNWENGLYFIVIKNNTDIYRKRFIKY